MNIQRLIQLNIELEGLLRVLADRENADAKQLLHMKYDEFKNAFDAELCSTDSEEPAAEKLVEPDAEPVVVEPVPEVTPTQVSEPVVEHEYTTVDEIVASRQNEMRVDEMLTRREAKDIRKAFTLNDKFRFRRELFANNDAQFADTLNVLSAMQNLDEAIEYMRDDLGWDMDADDVKDFVNIVNNHFSAV